MGQVKAQFDGKVVAAPELRGEGKSRRLQFPVYVNDRDKIQGTNDYQDSGLQTKIDVTVWGDKIEEMASDIQKSDILLIDAVLVEREYDRKDGGKGRALQTKFVNSIELVKRFESDAADEGGF